MHFPNIIQIKYSQHYPIPNISLDNPEVADMLKDDIKDAEDAKVADDMMNELASLLKPTGDARLEYFNSFTIKYRQDNCP